MSRAPLFSLVVLTSIVAMFSYIHPVTGDSNMDTLTDAKDVGILQTIQRSVIKLESYAEGMTDGIYAAGGESNRVMISDLDYTWSFFNQHFSNSGIKNIEALYPRVYCLAASVLEKGKPPMDGPQDGKDDYFNDLVKIYKKHRATKINSENYNEMLLMQTKTGQLITAFIGSGKEVTEQLVLEADQEFSSMIESGLSVGQTLGNAFEHIEIRAQFLGNIPATVLRLKMPKLKVIFGIDAKDPSKFRQRFMDELRMFGHEVKDGVIVKRS